MMDEWINLATKFPVSLHRYTISSVLGQFSRVSSSQIQLFEYSLFENISGGKNDGDDRIGTVWYKQESNSTFQNLF